MLVGRKATKYYLDDCPMCGRSQQIDFAKMLEETKNNGYTTLMCPWCEHTHVVHVVPNATKGNFRYTVDD